MPTAVEVVTRLVSAFTIGDEVQAISMVGPDCTLSTPAQESAGEQAREELAAYVGHIAPFARGHRMLRQWGDGQDVSSFPLAVHSGSRWIRTVTWHTSRGEQGDG